MIISEEAELRLYANLLVNENPIYKPAVLTILKVMVQWKNGAEIKLVTDKKSSLFIEGYDFTIYFTFSKTKKAIREMLKEHHNTIRRQFIKNAKVNLQEDRFIFNSKDAIAVCIQYLPYARFRAITYGLPKITTVNENAYTTVALLKYWKAVKNKKKIKNATIEKTVLESKYQKLFKIFGEAITHFQYDQNEVKEFLLKKMTKIF